jgi:outer membrane protein assembly factor BamE (lipoprotein component of BamABCDE complex)
LAIVSKYRISRLSLLAAAAAAAIAASGCASTEEVINNGFVADEQTLALAPVGASREQVLISLGSPSSTATFDNEVFYYISQKRERKVAFLKPSLVSQSVLAIYFDKNGVVAKKANYSMQDGKVVDMISRTTPTGGTELTFLQRILSGGAATGAQAAKGLLGGANKY